MLQTELALAMGLSGRLNLASIDRSLVDIRRSIVFRSGDGLQGWKDAFLDQRLPDRHIAGVVYGEHLDRYSPDRRQADQLGASPPKVLFPAVLSRMEQSHQFSGLRIEPSDVRTFVGIAAEARQCQVIRDCRATVFARDDVIDLEGQEIE